MKAYVVVVTIIAAAATCLGVATAATNSGVVNETRPAAQLYGKYCVSCHGKDGRAKTFKGKLNHARNLTDPGWQGDVSDERIYNSIMNGRKARGNMPAFNKKITDGEADSLVSLVRQLRQ